MSNMVGTTLTVTGTFIDAQATTCMNYIRRTWPWRGRYILDLLGKVLSRSDIWNACEAPGNAVFYARILKSKFILGVVDFSDAIAEIAEQLAWISAALRLAPNDRGIHTCTPFLNKSPLEIQPTEVPEIFDKLDASFKITCQILSAPMQVHSNGKCWHDLFSSAIIVKGYPIPKRTRENTGLEIPLDIMASLVEAPQILTFERRHFLKGFSSMLILTEQTDDLNIWHLDFKPDGSYISFQDASELPPAEGIDVDHVMNLRHIVGWCSNAKFYTGTDKALYPVKKPYLDALTDECILYGANVSLVRAIDKPLWYHKAHKEKPGYLHCGEDLHRRRLERLKEKYIVLWDVESKRGWLVNGVSAWLHLLRARLSHVSEDDGHGPQLKELSVLERYTVHSALKFFKNSENMNSAVYPSESQRNDDPFTIRDQSDRLYNTLDLLIEHQIAAVRSRSGASRKYLSGWAFRDLAIEKEQFEPYAFTLPEKGRSWVDFTRAISAVTLFGQSFGELICPDQSCEAWSELPRGNFYLATSGQVLKRIMDDVGNSPGQPWRLGRDIVWHNPTKLCKCSGRPESNHADNVQILLPEDISKDLLQELNTDELEENSAFVFGHNLKSRWLWQEFGSPTQTNSSLISENSNNSASENDSDMGFESGTSDDLPTFPKVYTVGILCTLPAEGAAMKTLFDEIHKEPDNYILGSIGGHNVALAYLPLESGIAAAAVAVSELARDHSCIEFGLLIGIGGGIPSSTTDIRLGDVVVGVPQGIYPGVIQLGRGKDLENRIFQRTGSLPPPPRPLLATIASLTADMQQCKAQLNEIIKDVTESRPEYQHPGQEFDVLNSAPCNQCRSKCTDRGNHVANRQPRESEHPIVHRGLIGSGDTVIKDSEKRDRLAEEYGIICVEMEAAGVMRSEIPFLVIRGISDYADSEKNDLWHKYASLTAAAFAKMVLKKISGGGSMGTSDWKTSKRNLPQDDLSLRSKKRRVYGR
ncbi:hypothetical protein F4777DRAFT_203974 [Nemania sp. FL0916]|nr:hypothetical protein F4777DRAFT_203974 [Nemania sp. FL0916]